MIGDCTFRTRAHRFGTGNTQKFLGLVLMRSLLGDQDEVFVCVVACTAMGSWLSTKTMNNSRQDSCVL